MPPDIIRIIDRLSEFEGKPGTHALIVGVSDYPHLEGGTGTPAPNAYGLGQLSSTALTAYKVFSWLKECRLETPLVTCRLLLSPSPIEKDTEPGLRNLINFYPATKEIFEDAAKGWRVDANSDEKNFTFFYFAGHGIQQFNRNNEKDPILLMEDFGDGRGGTFNKAVDTQNLVDGMKNISARTQMYFFDSCRSFHEELKNIRSKVHDLWDEKIGGKDDCRALVFYAAASGDEAYAIRGEQTYFGEALLKCLRGGAGDRREFEDFNGEERWYISLGTLSNKIKKHINALNEERNSNQKVIINGEDNLDDEKIICFLDAAPPVEVVFRVNPDYACQYTRIEVLDDRGNEIRVLPVPLIPHPHKCRLDAGNYTIRGIVDPPRPPLRNDPGRSRQYMPPLQKKEVKVMK